MGSNIPDSNWSERDDHNAENAPLGWPPGLPAKIEQIGQMMMGAIKRFWNKSNPVYLTTGTADAYVITTESQTTLLNLYEIIRVRIDRANTTTTPTLKFARTNARTIVKVTSAGVVPLIAGDMQALRDHSFWFNGTNYVISNPATIDSAVTVGLLKVANNLSDVANAATSLGNIGGAPIASPTFTGTVNISGLTASRAVATDASKNIISVATTGSGSYVLANSPALIGTPTAPTQSAGDNSTNIASTAYADRMVPLAGGTMSGNLNGGGNQIQNFLANTNLFLFADNSDPTKRLKLNLSGLTTATVRNVIVPDTDLALTKWEVIPGGVVAVTGQSSINFTNLSAYYRLRVSGVIWPSTATPISLRSSSNNGASYDSGASDYAYQILGMQGTGATSGVNGAGTAVPISTLGNVNATQNEAIAVNIEIDQFNAAANMKFLSIGTGINAGGGFLSIVGAQRAQATARNAFQFLGGAGTLSANLLVEGMRG